MQVIIDMKEYEDMKSRISDQEFEIRELKEDLIVKDEMLKAITETMSKK